MLVCCFFLYIDTLLIRIGLTDSLAFNLNLSSSMSKIKEKY